MINFKDSSASPALTAIFLVIIFLSCIISSFLNPIVFFYNKKKTSIAGLLFCVLSATDFFICVVFPAFILYYAATIDLTKMDCVLDESEKYLSQNCLAKATPTNLVTVTIMMCLNSTVFMTTSVLAILRSVQIKYPFYPIKKHVVVMSVPILVAIMATMWTCQLIFAHDQFVFLPSAINAGATNPFNLQGETETTAIATAFISSIPLSCVQFLAAIASIVTAITLIQQRKANGSSNLTKSRTIGAVKVLLTNIPSFIYAVMFGSPLGFAILKFRPSGGTLEEKYGWLSFTFPVVFSLLSSVWNPVVFVSLTAETRKTVKFVLNKISCCFN